MYGRFATNFVGRGLERGEIEAERVAEHELDVVATVKAVDEMRLEPAVELDGVHARDSLGEVFGQDAQARPDLEHDVVRLELREPPDDAEDVVVDEEVLPELAVGCDRELHGSENAAAAFPVDPRTEVGRVDAADPGERLEGEHDVRGLVRPAAAGLRRQVGAVRLDEDPLVRDLRRGGSQIGRLRVRDVAGERDVVAAFEHRLQQARRREAVHDDRAVEVRRGRRPCRRPRRVYG